MVDCIPRAECLGGLKNGENLHHAFCSLIEPTNLTYNTIIYLFSDLKKISIETLALLTTYDVCKRTCAFCRTRTEPASQISSTIKSRLPTYYYTVRILFRLQTTINCRVGVIAESVASSKAGGRLHSGRLAPAVQGAGEMGHEGH